MVRQTASTGRWRHVTYDDDSARSEHSKRETQMKARRRKIRYKQLFSYLGSRIADGYACDGTLRLAREFAEKHGLSFGELSQILVEMDGHCDCEALLNAAERIPADEVIGEETFQTPYRVAIERGWYFRCHVDGVPTDFDEAIVARKAGRTVRRLPCSKADLYAELDVNRAAIFLWA